MFIFNSEHIIWACQFPSSTSSSILGIDSSKFTEKNNLTDREMIEIGFIKEILEKSKTNKVSLLVVGDPFSAITHVD